MLDKQQFYSMYKLYSTIIIYIITLLFMLTPVRIMLFLLRDKSNERKMVIMCSTG